MTKQKELLWEKHKYKKSHGVTVNLALRQYGLKHFLINHFLQVKKTDRVLDIGCGYGETLFSIADEISSGFGLDVSQTAIEQAKKICKRLGKDNLFFEIGDANKVRFRSGSFDKVICFDVAEHMVEPDRLFREINRVLKGGGRAVVYTNFYGRFCWNYVKEFFRRRGKLERLWLRDAEVLHLNRFTRKQIENYFFNSGLNWQLVFKSHWLTPILIDLLTFLKSGQAKMSGKYSSEVVISDRVPLASKIQYWLSLMELKIFRSLESEGVFILINKPESK